MGNSCNDQGEEETEVQPLGDRGTVELDDEAPGTENPSTSLGE